MVEVKVSLEDIGECSGDDCATPTMDVEMLDLENEYIIKPVLQGDDAVSSQLDPLAECIKLEPDSSREVAIKGTDTGEEVLTARKFLYTCGFCGLQFEDIDKLSKHISKHKRDMKASNHNRTNSELLLQLLSNPQSTDSPPAGNKSVEKSSSKGIQYPAINSKKTRIASSSSSTQKKVKQNKPETTKVSEWISKNCPFCNMKCNSRAEFVSHTQTHITTGEDTGCNDCGLVCIHKALMQCDFCEEKFVTRTSALAHIRSHRRDVGNECEECNVYFATRQSWDEHVKLHEMYHCHLCTERFRLNRELFAHLKMHSSFDAYTCKQCNERFKEESELREHRKTHKIPKIWEDLAMRGDIEPWRVCEFCQRLFMRYHIHKSHMPTHAPFHCHMCKALYNDYEELQQHMRIEEHGYECDACNKKFDNKYWLKVHLGNSENNTRCTARIAESTSHCRAVNNQ